MNRLTFNIKGMHCRSCEMLIEAAFFKIPQVRQITVSQVKGTAEVFFEGYLDPRDVKKTVEEAGYALGIETKEFISRKWSDYKDLLSSTILIVLLYYILSHTGLLNFSFSSKEGYSNLFVVLLVGLTAGVSSCMALVGGLVLGISARHAEKHPEATPAQKFRPHLFFNLGRILGFFMLGGIAGFAGSLFQLSGPTLGIITIIVGLVMVTLGLQLIGIFPWLNLSKITLPPSIGKFFGLKDRHVREYSHKNSMITGALTFFLPCGFTQAMQLFAISSGNFWTGALTMSIFAIGTAPGLLGVGGFTSVIKGTFAKKFFKFAGILVIILAVVNISNGLNLTGWQFGSGSRNTGQENVNDPNVTIENGVQIIRMTQTTFGYSPNKFTIQAGIPSKWVITSKDSNSCAASITSSKLGIKKLLKAGENIIEFTPKETGEAGFSCLMGMYRGSFTIVENKGGNVTQTSSTTSQTETITPRVESRRGPQDLTNTPTAIGEELTPGASSSDEAGVQVLRATYAKSTEMVPKKFVAKAGLPVRFELDVQDNGSGCMSTIMIPGLVNEPELLEKGTPIVFNFTPQKPGSYQITCAMGAPRGTLTVI